MSDDICEDSVENERRLPADGVSDLRDRGRLAVTSILSRAIATLIAKVSFEP
jgi:hypothetical protein